MNPRLLALSIALSSLALAACGNKGPLVQAPPDPVEETADQDMPAEADVPAEDQTETDGLAEPEATPADTTEPPAESEPEQTPPASDGGG